MAFQAQYALLRRKDTAPRLPASMRIYFETPTWKLGVAIVADRRCAPERPQAGLYVAVGEGILLPDPQTGSLIPAEEHSQWN